jgi:pyruvate/2-oxoglutarate dehydrogenase complex dihydrolipoamide dehydrogenase (E3) component
MATYDVIVIGAGPAGEVVAGRSGEAGLSVAVVERELVGGECSYYACMPSKALLRPGDLAAEIARVPGVSGGELDPAAILRRRDEVIHNRDDASYLPWLEERGVTLLRGAARLSGERRVTVGDDEYEARRAVVVATGSDARIPPIPGLAEAKPWTNREGTNSERVPASLVVLGGGVVGVELADAWASLGSNVTLLEMRDRVIPGEEPEASQLVADGLTCRGVDVRLGIEAVGVSRTTEEVAIECQGGAASCAEELLVGLGREPRTRDLGVETVGLEPGKSIEVDEQMRSRAADWLFAVGDVNGRALLTHMGKEQARIAADVIAGRNPAPVAVDGRQSPRVIFTDPQVAAVGHTLASAQEAGLNVRAVDHSPESVAGGSFVGRGADGFARLVVDEDRRVLAGATFVGPEVAEFVHAATIAVVGEVPLERLWHAVPCFPTRSEVWLRLLERYGL